jgi:transcriptional regulator NrdR family protein
VPFCTFGVEDKNGKKIISQLHAVDRIFGFTYIKFLSIFALFEDSDELANIYILERGTHL